MSYAKQQLGSKCSETKILGIHWNKAGDTFEIGLPLEKYKAAKRGIVRKLASIYNPLDFISPVHLMRKIIYRMISEKKLAWMILYRVTSLKSDSNLHQKKYVNCFIESPLKIIKNAFYFISKGLFILKIFMRKIRLISKFMT